LRQKGASFSGVSFDLELGARVGSWEEAERVEAATASAGHLPVLAGRRRRWWRELEPSIAFDGKQGQAVLDDAADWDEDAFTLSPSGRAALAATALTLGELLAPGWTLRAYWGGDPVRHEQAVTARELASLVRQSKLDRYTLYRVA
jgi:hypothetical protein